MHKHSTDTQQVLESRSNKIKRLTKFETHKIYIDPEPLKSLRPFFPPFEVLDPEPDSMTWVPTVNPKPLKGKPKPQVPTNQPQGPGPPNLPRLAALLRAAAWRGLGAYVRGSVCFFSAEPCRFCRTGDFGKRSFPSILSYAFTLYLP